MFERMTRAVVNTFREDPAKIAARKEKQDRLWEKYASDIRRHAQEYAELFFNRQTNPTPTRKQQADFLKQCQTITDDQLSEKELITFGVLAELADCFDASMYRADQERDRIADESAREAFGELQGVRGEAALLDAHDEGFRRVRKQIRDQEKSFKERMKGKIEDALETFQGRSNVDPSTTETAEQRFEFLQQEFPVLMERILEGQKIDIASQLNELLEAVQNESKTRRHDPAAWRRLGEFLSISLGKRLEHIVALSQREVITEREDGRAELLGLAPDLYEQKIDELVEAERLNLFRMVEDGQKNVSLYQAIRLFASQLPIEEKMARLREILQSLPSGAAEQITQIIKVLRPQHLQAFARSRDLAEFKGHLEKLEQLIAHVSAEKNEMNDTERAVLERYTEVGTALSHFGAFLEDMSEQTVMDTDGSRMSIGKREFGQTIGEEIHLVATKLIPQIKEELRTFDTESRGQAWREESPYEDPHLHERESFDQVEEHPYWFVNQILSLHKALKQTPGFYVDYLKDLALKTAHNQRRKVRVQRKRQQMEVVPEDLLQEAA